tara:strand:+ start:95 stop:307 length:213 start_codon:yes stop_codon:yes gene_type:complete
MSYEYPAPTTPAKGSKRTKVKNRIHSETTSLKNSGKKQQKKLEQDEEKLAKLIKKQEEIKEQKKLKEIEY